MKHLTALLLLATPVLFWGCSQTIYDRSTLTVDSNGAVTLEAVHIGSTGVATSKTIEELVIKTARGSMVLNQATAENDSVKATTPYGIIETSKKGQ